MDPLIRYCFAISSPCLESKTLLAQKSSDSRLEGLVAMLAQLLALNIETPLIKPTPPPRDFSSQILDRLSSINARLCLLSLNSFSTQYTR